LVLDDDLDIKALIKMALQKQGYRVFGFTDPFLALEHFKNTHSAYSLVISDLRMPGINGFEFIQRIRTINSKVKILRFRPSSSKTENKWFCPKANINEKSGQDSKNVCNRELEYYY